MTFRTLPVLALLLTACGGSTFTPENDADGGPATGGASSSGGSRASGGAPASGGTPSTGGVRATGGAGRGSGGALASGGAGSGAGGGAASGGAAGAGGSGPVDCGPAVTLRMVPGGPAASSKFCIGAPHQCGGGSWFSIERSDGTPVTLFSGCTMADCATCQQFGCPAFCAMSSPLAESGVEVKWDGSNWNTKGTCEAGFSCASRACSPPGKYLARLCGYALGSSDGGPLACEDHASTTPTCVDVPFVYPSNGDVVGVLDPSR